MNIHGAAPTLRKDLSFAGQANRAAKDIGQHVGRGVVNALWKAPNMLFEKLSGKKVTTEWMASRKEQRVVKRGEADAASATQAANEEREYQLKDAYQYGYRAAQSGDERMKDVALNAVKKLEGKLDGNELFGDFSKVLKAFESGDVYKPSQFANSGSTKLNFGDYTVRGLNLSNAHTKLIETAVSQAWLEASKE